jgi:hypothetical protein
MILASHGLIASQIASFDADAVAFFGRVTTAGGSLSATEKAAVNTLVLDLKANSLWTPMKAIYPMVGASAAACAQNLKSSSFTGTFTSGWTFASTGATGNGTSAYFDTQLSPSAVLSNDNLHLSFYSRTQNTSVSGMCMGTRLNGTNEQWMSLYYAAVVTKLFNNGSYSANTAISSNTNTLGLQIGSQVSTTSRKLYFAGSLLNTNTTSYSATNPSANMYISAYNNSGPTQFTPHQCAFSSIGDGLDDTQASNFYTAVQAFQTTLSRNV